jgi:hypothetical protein
LAIWYIFGHLVYFWSFGIFCGGLVYFVVIWYIFPNLACCAKKNLATLPDGTAVQSTFAEKLLFRQKQFGS